MKDEMYKNLFLMLLENISKENVTDGLVDSLENVEEYTKSNGVILYKYEDNKYIPYKKTRNYDYKDTSLNKFIKIYDVINKSSYYNIDVNFREKNIINNNELDIKKISFVTINNNDSKYIMVLLNNNLSNEIEYFNMLGASFKELLKISLLHEKQDRLIRKNSLTDLDNRYSYNDTAEKYINNNQNVAYVFLDLFRLKHVNDTYGHIMGDVYIKTAATLLKRTFSSSGNYIYHISGDEFVLISTVYQKDEIEKRMKIINDELVKLRFNEDDDIYLYLNYGISIKENNKSLNEMHKEAEDNMSINKREIYDELKVDRRK